MGIKAGLLAAVWLGTGMAALAAGSAAMAADDAQVTGEARDTATAARSAAGDNPLDIVVTAQRREERLSDVPVSISVVSATELTSAGAKTGAALQGMVPGLQINATASYGGSPVSIRGTSGLGGAEDPVAVYVDDVYTPSGQFSVTALSDIRSVEVARGPQGTLQGRNATAGALIIRTADPEPVAGGFFRASVEAPLAYRVEGVITGPLSDTLSARLSLDRIDERGWATNIFDGSHMGGLRMFNARTVLLWEPTPAFRARLSLNYQNRRVSQPSARWAYTHISPPPGPVTPVGTQTPQIPLPEDVQRQFLDGKIVNLNLEPHSILKAPSMTLNLQYDFGAFSLISVTGAMRATNDGMNDSDALAMTDRQGRNAASYVSTAFSEEIRLQSNGENTLDWILGFFYGRYVSDMDFDIYNLRLSQPYDQMSNFVSHQVNPTWAVFGDATLHLTPSLSVIGGVRYTKDIKDFRNVWSSIYVPTGSVLISIPFTSPRRSWNDVSYRAKAAWKPTDDTLAYVSYSRGFKAGGFNGFGVGPQPGYNPEVMKSWEVGVKAFFGGRGFVSASAYHNDYDNLQVTSGVPTGGVVITNAASARIKGFEIEGELRATDNLVFNANVAYTHGRFLSFPLAPDILGHLRDVSGNVLTNAPEWQYFLQARYDVDLSPDWRLSASTDWRWRDEVYFFPTDQDLVHLRGKANGELGARIGLTYVPEDLTISIYGTNLTDSRVVANEAMTFSYPQAFFNRPRIVGVQFIKNF